MELYQPGEDSEVAPVLRMDGRQVTLAKLDNPQVGQVFVLTCRATICGVETGKGTDGLPTTSACVELTQLAFNPVAPTQSQTMYPSMHQ